MANKGGALNDKKLITAMREALLLLAFTANQLLFYCFSAYHLSMLIFTLLFYSMHNI